MSTGRLVHHCVGRLLVLQHSTGGWTDFRLAPGSSSSWVTGYAGCSLAVAAADPRMSPGLRLTAGRAADRAVTRLLAEVGADGGWGYSPDVRPDADSTAWVVRLIALRRPAGWRATTRTALSFLDRHATPAGYRTYADADSGRWSDPSPDVTAAVLLARLAAGDLVGRAPAETAETADLLMGADADGRWASLWWAGDRYPTAIVASARAAVGRSADVRVRQPAVDASGWELATELWTASSVGDRAQADRLRLRLAGSAVVDGGWPGGADLVAPAPAQPSAGVPARPTTDERSVDARGVFTTATVLHAALAGGRPGPHRHRRNSRTLLAYSTSRPHVAGSIGSVVGSPTVRLTLGDRRRRPFDDELAAIASAGGIHPGRAVALVRTLTAESLGTAVRWPSDQLSELAGGIPLEFSVGAQPGLRLTTEVGDPRLPPQRRLTDGLAAIQHTVRTAGLAAEWSAARAAIATLLDPDRSVPADNRFWLWAGLDITPTRTSVKAYASLLAGHPPGWRHRLTVFLDGLQAPAGSPVRSIVELLGTSGWGHEVGVGVTHGGWGAKVYFELHGFRRQLVTETLRTAGFSDDIGPLTPEIPGVLRASLAARSRAGIAVRVVPGTGEVTEVAVAAAFPPPMVGRVVLAERVQHWLDYRGAGGPHAAAVETLLPRWSTAPPHDRLHSLFTLSRSRCGDEVKVYLRSAGPVGQNAVSI